MIPFTRRAAEHLAALRSHYEALDRPEALGRLIDAVQAASDAIERNPTAGLAAPRPYPWLAQTNRSWVKSHRYWIAYRIRPRLLIVGIFYDTANIPKRL